jgi:uncharacterized protein
MTGKSPFDGPFRATIQYRKASQLRKRLAAASSFNRDDLGGALVHAADIGWVTGIELLLTAGADANWHPNGWSGGGFPLAQAIYWLHLTTIERLLDAGADIEALDHNGMTPLHHALYTEVDLAIKDPPTAEVTALLLERGADARARLPSGQNALELAEKLGHVVAAELLRKHLVERPGLDVPAGAGELGAAQG